MFDQDDAAWTARNTRGPKLALVGRSVEAVLLALARADHAVTAYVSNPSSVDAWLASQAVNDRKAIELRRIPSLGADEPGVTVDTVVVFGRSNDIEGPDGFLLRIQRVVSAGGRLVLVLPNFGDECSGDDGFDFPAFIEYARRSLIPIHLSFADEALRFVGEFGVPEADAWSGFERSVWPCLLRDGIRSVAVRNRREVAGLQLRLGRIQGMLASTSYRLGTAVVRAANRPAMLWRLPATLWRIYRSRRHRPSAGRIESRQQVVFPPLPLPQPNASGRPVVAAILDTFSDYCLRYELDLVRLTPEHWRREIEASSPLHILVESAWAGNEGRWRGVIDHNQNLDLNPLRDMVLYCRSKGIKTVFWNKEDPPNFDYFIAAARQFDVIFTSDADCVPRYREVCGHDHVYVMPFAAQPKIHNPCRGETWPRYTVCFAGSWRGEAYGERTESISALLDPALEFGLHIMDRNLRRTNTRSSVRFPDRYRKAVKSSLDYQEMLTAYRCYDVMLNANSVTESPTMFSRRVFEALACATPVVSMDSVGMRAMLGKHVRVARTDEETAAHLETLLGDGEARVREGHLAYRFVHENHTYRHRVDNILREADIAPVPRSRPTVSVIALLRDARRLEAVLGNFAAQKYRKKNLLVYIDSNDIGIDDVSARLEGLDDAAPFDGRTFTTFGEGFNQALEQVSGTYIAVFSDADRYGECYVSDTMLAANFSDADVLGKGSYYSYDRSCDALVLRNKGMDHRFVNSVATATIVGVRDVLRDTGLAAEATRVDCSLLARATEKGYRVYSTDRFNYLNVCGEKAGTTDNDLSTKLAGVTLHRVMI